MLIQGSALVRPQGRKRRLRHRPRDDNRGLHESALGYSGARQPLRRDAGRDNARGDAKDPRRIAHRGRLQAQGDLRVPGRERQDRLLRGQIRKAEDAPQGRREAKGLRPAHGQGRGARRHAKPSLQPPRRHQVAHGLRRGGREGRGDAARHQYRRDVQSGRRGQVGRDVQQVLRGQARHHPRGQRREGPAPRRTRPLDGAPLREVGQGHHDLEAPEGRRDGLDGARGRDSREAGGGRREGRIRDEGGPAGRRGGEGGEPDSVYEFRDTHRGKKEDFQPPSHRGHHGRAEKAVPRLSQANRLHALRLVSGRRRDRQAQQQERPLRVDSGVQPSARHVGEGPRLREPRGAVLAHPPDGDAVCWRQLRAALPAAQGRLLHARRDPRVRPDALDLLGAHGLLQPVQCG